MTRPVKAEPCPVCGVGFKPVLKEGGRRKRFCSLECRLDGLRHELVPCLVCDTLFVPKLGRDWTRHCSFACSRVALRGATYRRKAS